MLPQQINDIAHQMMAACPACGTKNSFDAITVVEQKKQGFMAHLTCSRCGAGLVARITYLPHGLLGNALVTDLENYEVGRFKDGPPVTVDDVLSIHQVNDLTWSKFINQK